jgi:hypothetical protein
LLEGPLLAPFPAAKLPNTGVFLDYDAAKLPSC